MNLTNFQFKGRAVRVVDINGTPHFVGIDVAECLGYAKPRNAIAAHCKGALKWGLPSVSGNQEYTVIPEADVYRLTLRSKAPKAEEFQDWVCETVLPQIRATGSFESNPKPPSFGQILDLANFYREKAELLGDLMADIVPANLHLYGTTDSAGRVYNGIRRASITRSLSRLREASAFHVKVCQLEMQELLESGKAIEA